MQQQLFGLTGGILDLNEHLNENHLGQDYASDCRGHSFPGEWVPGSCLRICAAYLSPGAGTAQSLAQIVTEAGNTAWHYVCLCVRMCAVCSPLMLAEEGSWTSEVRGICDRFAHPLLAQNGLRGTIASFSENFRVFCAHRVSPNRHSQTLIRISCQMVPIIWRADGSKGSLNRFSMDPMIQIIPLLNGSK